MKTLHRFLIKSYIPPFFMTLFIGMFIFFIIFVFVYIDDIAGKGISGWDLTQLLFYTFVSNLPKSVPLAVLLSSIMTMGNLAEKYEMAALKSAGLSLFRIMNPLIIFIIFLSISTFLFSNYTMPYIQLKAGRLLWDIRESKPAFNVKEGIYYPGLEDYRIRVEEKAKDGTGVHDIYIADHSSSQDNNIQILADSGTMKTTDDKNFLVLKIYGGTRYQHLLNSEHDYETRPFVRMKFKEQEIKIDLTELQMRNTAEELFKNNYQMLNLTQLEGAVDSFRREENKILNRLNQEISKNFTPISSVQSKKADSLKLPHLTTADKLKMFDKNGRDQLIDKALESVRSAHAYVSSLLERDLRENNLTRYKYEVEWHRKLTLPIACLVLFFVGAPLGAIVRKGGMGLPVVISVVIFLLFHVFSTSFEKSYLEGASSSTFVLWASTVIFFPLGFWLTWMAANDSAIFDKASYKFLNKFKTKIPIVHLASTLDETQLKKEEESGKKKDRDLHQQNNDDSPRP